MNNFQRCFFLKEDLAIGYFLYNNRKPTYKNIFYQETIYNFPINSKIKFETLFNNFYLGSNSQGSNKLKSLPSYFTSTPSNGL